VIRISKEKLDFLVPWCFNFMLQRFAGGKPSANTAFDAILDQRNVEVDQEAQAIT
jgi:hypothetical protein